MMTVLMRIYSSPWELGCFSRGLGDLKGLLRGLDVFWGCSEKNL